MRKWTGPKQQRVIEKRILTHIDYKMILQKEAL